MRKNVKTFVEDFRLGAEKISQNLRVALQKVLKDQNENDGVATGQAI